jgi:hypothetical protein
MPDRLAGSTSRFTSGYTPMIDTTVEKPIPLTEAAAELPRRRRGKKTNVSTLYRWATAGCKGVVLETIQVGGTRCTSREGLQRFFEKLTLPRQAGNANTAPIAAVRSAAQRQRRSEEAALKLAEMGV